MEIQTLEVIFEMTNDLLDDHIWNQWIVQVQSSNGLWLIVVEKMAIIWKKGCASRLFGKQ